MIINKINRRRTFRIAAGIIILSILLLAGGAGAVTQINSCTMISRPGDYVLTRNITNSSAVFCINITSGNVIFDGAGNTIDGKDTYDSYGIYVYNPGMTLANVTVKNLKVTDWHFGIYYRNIQNGKISNSTASSNLFGTRLSYCSNSSLIRNDVRSNDDDGMLFDYSNNNTLTGNNVISNTFGIHFQPFSNNNIIAENNISSNTYTGIWFGYSFLSFDISRNNILFNNTANSNGDGIVIRNFRNSTISGNRVNSNRGAGIILFTSAYNTLTDTNAGSNKVGIQLNLSSYNALTNNTASSNRNTGISLGYSMNNTLTGNLASSNIVGIHLFYSQNNTIYNNYFNNTNNALDNGNNIWNITKRNGMNIAGGPYLGGNYWSDYAGTDSDGDGLGDTLVPYNSSGNIINRGDYLPLTGVAG